MRTRPSGPSASRTARTRATSSASGRRLRDLHLGRAAAGEAGEHAGDGLRAQGGHGRVDADLGRGAAPAPRTSRSRSPPRASAAASASPYSGNGRELGPAGRALEQGGLAHRDAAEPRDHRQRDDAEPGEQVVDGREHPPILAPYAADMAVSELFDPERLGATPAASFTDITDHRSLDGRIARIAFDRPEVRNAFRPQRSTSWPARSRTPAPTRRSASCCSPATARARRTAAGRSAPAATSGSAAATATSTRAAGRAIGGACTSSRCSGSSASCRRSSSRSCRAGRPAAATRCTSSATSRSRPPSTGGSSRRMRTSARSTAATAAPTSPARSARSSPARSSSSPGVSARAGLASGRDQRRGAARGARVDRHRVGARRSSGSRRRPSGC